MTTQPEALRLADDLTKHLGGNTATQAAAELLRLHKVNQELIKALKDLLANDNLSMTQYLALHRNARAAITKAERTTI